MQKTFPLYQLQFSSLYIYAHELVEIITSINLVNFLNPLDS